MAKIILSLFALKPLLDCLIISLMMINAMRITEASSYLALMAICVHYFYIGLKEVFIKKES